MGACAEWEGQESSSVGVCEWNDETTFRAQNSSQSLIIQSSRERPGHTRRESETVDEIRRKISNLFQSEGVSRDLMSKQERIKAYRFRSIFLNLSQ